MASSQHARMWFACCMGDCDTSTDTSTGGVAVCHGGCRPVCFPRAAPDPGASHARGAGAARYPHETRACSTLRSGRTARASRANARADAALCAAGGRRAPSPLWRRLRRGLAGQARQGGRRAVMARKQPVARPRAVAHPASARRAVRRSVSCAHPVDTWQRAPQRVVLGLVPGATEQLCEAAMQEMTLQTALQGRGRRAHPCSGLSRRHVGTDIPLASERDSP